MRLFLLPLLPLVLGAVGSLAACSSSDDTVSPDAATPNTTGTTVEEDGGATGRDGGDAGDGATGHPSDGGAKDAGPDLAALQKRKAQMLTSFWENDTMIFQYAFSRNNNDGFGYTSGRVGFTTATGDAYQIVKCFDAAYTGAGNLMKKYEAPLAALYQKKLTTGQSQPDTSTLDAVGSFTADWKTTANTAATAPAFDGCQDQRVDASYWTPAVAFATKWGLKTALSHASIYDAFIVHGEANVSNVAKQANNDTGNTAQTPPAAPLSQAAESTWLASFNLHRTALINSSGAWRGAIARGANYEQQRRNGNFAFTSAIVTDANANTVFPGNGYSSNSYQACSINPDGSVSGVAQCTAPVSN